MADEPYAALIEGHTARDGRGEARTLARLAVGAPAWPVAVVMGVVWIFRVACEKEAGR